MTRKTLLAPGRAPSPIRWWEPIAWIIGAAIVFYVILAIVASGILGTAKAATCDQTSCYGDPKWAGIAAQLDASPVVLEGPFPVASNFTKEQFDFAAKNGCHWLPAIKTNAYQGAPVVARVTLYQDGICVKGRRIIRGENMWHVERTLSFPYCYQDKSMWGGWKNNPYSIHGFGKTEFGFPTAWGCTGRWGVRATISRNADGGTYTHF